MRFKEYLTERSKNPNRDAAKKARRDARNAVNAAALAQLHADGKAREKAEYDAKYAAKYDGKPMQIQITVIGAGNKEEKREFTIDNTQKSRSLKYLKLRDMSTVESDPRDRHDQPSYVIEPKHPGDEASIPKLIHGLPKGTRKRKGYSKEDLRREAYVE